MREVGLQGCDGPSCEEVCEDVREGYREAGHPKIHILFPQSIKAVVKMVPS